MDLGKLLFGQSYNEAVDPYREEAKAARDAAIDAQFIEGLDYDDKMALIESADKYANQTASDYAKALKDNQYNVFGNGVVGTLLNPVAQVLDTAVDVSGSEKYLKKALGQELTDDEKAQMEAETQNPINFINPVSKVSSGLSNRYSEESPYLQDLGGIRDEWTGDKTMHNPISDLGAAIDAASLAVGGGTLGAGMSLGKKAALEAGLGGLQQLGYGLEKRGNLGDDESNVLSDIATGAAFGAAIPVAGSVAGKVGNRIAQRGENYLANEALARGIANNATDAAQIAKNTGRTTKARAAFSSLPKWGKIGLVGGTAAGGATLANLLNSNANNQTGYDDEAVYGSDKYGTTQGYNYGTYGY